jgi:uncharacterized protein (DUF885 family)
MFRLTISLGSLIGFGLFAPAALPQQPSLRDWIEEYRVDRSDLDRFYSVDGSPTKRARFERFAADWRARLDAVAFAALDPDSQVDWILLSDRLDFDRADRALTGSQLDEDAAFLGFASELGALEEGRWELEGFDPETVATRLDALAKDVKALSEKLRKEDAAAAADSADTTALPPLSRPRALRIASAVDDSVAALDRFAYHYLRYDPPADWWLGTPIKALRDALTAYRDKLRGEIAGKKGGADEPLVGEPIGRDRLLAGLRRERISYTPEELIAIGEQQLAFCDAEMAKAARELGKDSIATALEIVKSHRAPAGQQDDLVHQLATEAIAFLDHHELVTIPDLCRETWRVDMMPLGSQRFLPFAAYGDQCMIVNYVADDQPLADRLAKMADNNIHFTRNVTPHELIPGHHLQGFMGDRHRPYRRLFSTPFLGEGWCLYFEFRFLDLGWAKSPEDRLGILFWRKHRAARIVVSLSYHLGIMAPDAMIAVLRDRVGWGNDAATGEVRRFLEGGYGPLYQCAYMLGGLQLLDLHRELVASGKFTERAFHDAVLRENAIPIELIRARLAKQPLTRDRVTDWRFAPQ